MYYGEDRRKAKQIEKRNNFGELEEIIIPSYTKKDFFLTGNEYKIYCILNEIYKNNKDICIFVQVALNSIIDINNQRSIHELNDLKFNERSIDFVIYNSNKNIQSILYCLELNGEEHYTNEKIMDKDRKINNIFKIAGIELKTLRVLDIDVNDKGYFDLISVKKLLNI